MEMNYAYLCAVLVCLFTIRDGADGQAAVTEEQMRTATDRLYQRFQQLRRDELGVTQLQSEYAGSITISTLTDSARNELLSEATPTNTINRIVQQFDDVINNVTTVMDGATVSDCSENNSGPSCCLECLPSQQTIAARAAAAFSNIQIEGLQLQLGLPNGALVRSPSSNTTITSALLQPWYSTATLSRPREIVILADLYTTGLPSSASTSVSQIRTAAISLIRSFTPTDKVAVVFTDHASTCGDSLIAASPVHTEELISAINVVNAIGIQRVSEAIAQSYGLFTNDSNDKLLIYIGDGRQRTSLNPPGSVPDFISNAVTRTMQGRASNPTVTFQAYRVNALQSGSVIGQISQQLSFTVNLATSIANYYSSLINSSALTSTHTLTAGFSTLGAPSLSISRLWLDNGTVVGVFHAFVPWQSLFDRLANFTSTRASSYYFVLNQEGTILYNQLVAVSDILGLNQTSILEPEQEFSDVIQSVTSGNNGSRTVPKTMIVPFTDALSGSYIVRSVPSSYHWMRVWSDGDQQQLYVCLLLADEDVSVRTRFDGVDVQSIYSASPLRLPTLHTDLSNADDLAMCDYYCLQSIRVKRLGLQLTTPIPITNQNINTYLGGTGSRPSTIPDGTAEEVAIASVLQSTWTRDNNSDAAITGRQLATPTGIYLSYPAVELGAALRPQLFSWYISASALPSETVLLSPASRDLVTEQSVYTVSSSVRINSNGQVLAVVSANLTERSLREEVNTAFDGLCGRSGYSCAIINSESFFVLQPEDVQTAHPEYIADYKDGTILFNVVQSMLSSGRMVKTGCSDLRDIATSNQLFYKVDTSSNDVYCDNPSLGRYDYCMQRINGTNSVLLVFKENTNPTPTLIFSCFEDCNNCGSSFLKAPACVCRCQEERCSPALEFPLCPVPVTASVNHSLATNMRLTNSQSTRVCFDQQCCSRDLQSCLSAHSCTWCGGSPSGCVPTGSCCPDQRQQGAACCNESSISALPPCFGDQCRLNPQACPLTTTPNPSTLTITPTPSTDPSTATPTPSTTAAIIGGVIGGLFALVLIALLVVFVLWYQFCRAPELEESTTKQKGVFNFTDVKPSATNTTAVELAKGGESPEQNSPRAPSEEKDLDKNTIV